MVQTPVGVRCRECAGLRRLPTFDVRPGDLARAVGAGALVAVAIGLAWGFVYHQLSLCIGGFCLGLHYIVLLLAATVIGEAVSIAVNRKRGTTLGVVAVICVALCVAASVMVSRVYRQPQSAFSIVFDLIVLAFAFVTAYRRASP
jgi:hypothetical protein